MTKIEKYRPYLTLDEIDMCSSALRLLPEIPFTLMTYLDRYAMDIKIKNRVANITTKPSIAASLEMDARKPDNPMNNPEILYDQYIESGYRGMNAEQLMILKNHLYMNDLFKTDKDKYDYGVSVGEIGADSFNGVRFNEKGIYTQEWNNWLINWIKENS